MSTRGLPKFPKIEDIPLEDRNPTVVVLREIGHRQQEEIQLLRDEVARLKGQKDKPGACEVRNCISRSMEAPPDERCHAPEWRWLVFSASKVNCRLPVMAALGYRDT